MNTEYLHTSYRIGRLSPIETAELSAAEGEKSLSVYAFKARGRGKDREKGGGRR